MICEKYLLGRFLSPCLDWSHTSMRVVRLSTPAPLSLLRSTPNICTGLARDIKLSTTPALRPQSCAWLNISTTFRTRQFSTLTSSTSRIMADEKGGKQATLGYVKDGQQTLGCVGDCQWRMRPSHLCLCFIISNYIWLMCMFVSQKVLRFQCQSGAQKADHVSVWWEKTAGRQ